MDLGDSGSLLVRCCIDIRDQRADVRRKTDDIRRTVCQYVFDVSRKTERVATDMRDDFDLVLQASAAQHCGKFVALPQATRSTEPVESTRDEAQPKVAEYDVHSCS
ncbi:MAG: hypothetical protein AAF678_01875 [Pseudomonadota bacterium]